MKIRTADGQYETDELKRAYAARELGESYVVDLDDNIHLCSFAEAVKAVKAMEQ